MSGLLIINLAVLVVDERRGERMTKIHKLMIIIVEMKLIRECMVDLFI